MDNKEYILCAAIKRITPKDCSPYHEGTNDICDIEIGYRHHDILQRFHGEVSTNPYDQGFYTSKGRFVDRQEAMYIAYVAGQVSETSGIDLIDFTYKGDMIRLNKLYSEDLY